MIWLFVFLLFLSGIAIQLSQVIRLLLDPENMALTANVSFTERPNLWHFNCFFIMKICDKGLLNIVNNDDVSTLAQHRCQISKL